MDIFYISKDIADYIFKYIPNCFKNGRKKICLEDC